MNSVVATIKSFSQQTNAYTKHVFSVLYTGLQNISSHTLAVYIDLWLLEWMMKLLERICDVVRLRVCNNCAKICLFFTSISLSIYTCIFESRIVKFYWRERLRQCAACVTTQKLYVRFFYHRSFSPYAFQFSVSEIMQTYLPCIANISCRR